MIEQFLEGRGPDASELQRLVPHIAQATCHALDQEQIFLLPMRRVVGRWIEKSKLTRTKARLALAGLAFMIGLLTFVKVPYRVQAMGRLMPSQQFRAYAPFDCQVREILVRTGQHVQAKQPLVNLYDESLETRLLILTNSIEEKQQLLAAHKAELDENAAKLSPAEKIGLSAKNRSEFYRNRGPQTATRGGTKVIRSSQCSLRDLRNGRHLPSGRFVSRSSRRPR